MAEPAGSRQEVLELLRDAGRHMRVLYGHAPGVFGWQEPGAWLVATGAPDPLANWFTILEGGVAGERALRASVRRLRTLGVPGLVYFASWVATELEPICEELGLYPPGVVPLMARTGSPSPVTDTRFTLATVRDASTFQVATGVIARAFEMSADVLGTFIPPAVLSEPGLTFYTASRDGEIWSVVGISRSGPLAYVDIMATDPERKRQGAGKAVLLHGMADQAARGAERWYLIASTEGQSLYAQLGFRTIDKGITRMVPVLADHTDAPAG